MMPPFLFFWVSWSHCNRKPAPAQERGRQVFPWRKRKGPGQRGFPFPPPGPGLLPPGLAASPPSPCREEAPRPARPRRGRARPPQRGGPPSPKGGRAERGAGPAPIRGLLFPAGPYLASRIRLARAAASSLVRNARGRRPPSLSPKRMPSCRLRARSPRAQSLGGRASRSRK